MKAGYSKLNTELLLAAYMGGYFPMARSRKDTHIEWYHPEMRGIIPLDDFHIPRRLARQLKQSRFQITADRDFASVIKACAETTPKRSETWINDTIIALYTELACKGFAHSVECYLDGELVGGLYGVAIGGVFCGESMFSRVPGASKAAIAILMPRLRDAGYILLDTQYINPHLLQFGAREIPRVDYLRRLEAALDLTPGNAFGF